MFAARMFAYPQSPESVGSMERGKPIEVLLLSPESSEGAAKALSSKAHGQFWRAMLRSANIVPGTRLIVGNGAESHLQMIVKGIHSSWEEEEVAKIQY